jgi:DNA recombination protein RmuC
MEYIIALAALIIGLILGFGLAFFRAKSEQSRLEVRNIQLDKQVQEIQDEEQEARKKSSELEKELAGLQADYRNLQEKLNEQKTELSKMQEDLKVQFENLANKILDEKSEKFTKQNREQLDQLLNPLGDKLEEFKKKVEHTYNEETRERATLKEQIRQMAELNQKMSEDAKNLTRALKGDTKAQGNWGEVILQRILEKSGLEKGREYEIQESTTTKDGRRLQPDVIIKLPDEKFLIVDSKVSLTAYEKMVSAENESEVEHIIKQHIASVRAHVKGLSEKNYQQIHGDQSPDFVLLFIPIEPAFGLALQHDSSLYLDAFEKNIVIVSPSTLLATLGTIQSVWKQEYQNKNALEIAQRGGALYDKFVNFVESMTEIGQRIHQTQLSYDEAMNRLRSGRGNLIRQAEMMRKLGVKNTKQLAVKSESSDEEE